MSGLDTAKELKGENLAGYGQVRAWSDNAATGCRFLPAAGLACRHSVSRPAVSGPGHHKSYEHHGASVGVKERSYGRPSCATGNWCPEACSGIFHLPMLSAITRAEADAVCAKWT